MPAVHAVRRGARTRVARLLLPLLAIVTAAPLAGALTSSPAVAEDPQPAETRTWVGPGNQTVTAGQTAVVQAAVATTDGARLAGRRVVLYRHTPSGWRGTAAGVTNSRGEVAIKVRPTGTTRYGAVYAGDEDAEGSKAPQSVEIAVSEPAAEPADSGSSRGERVVAKAATYKGRPYRYGATGPSSFDCSGYVRYVYQQFGVTLPHNSGAMYDVVQHISLSELRPGDLVFTQHGGRIGHVGIYAGDFTQWHSPQSGETVTRSSLNGRNLLAGRVR